MHVVKIFQHKNISEEHLSEAAKIKSLRWNYPIAEHIGWMRKHLLENDYHLLVYIDKHLVGYANLVDISATINKGNVKLRGIGNVCTSETGKGFGNVLMKEMNTVLKQNQWEGILLCKDLLIHYYGKFGWELIDRKLIKTAKYTEVNFMVYNIKQIISSLEYDGRNF